MTFATNLKQIMKLYNSIASDNMGSSVIQIFSDQNKKISKSICI